MGRRGPQPQDLTGQKFGHLTVLEMIAGDSAHSASARCRCDCGNEVVVRIGNLKKGNSKSCGCRRNYCDGEPSAKTLKAFEARQVNRKKIRDNNGEIIGLRFGRLVVTGIAGRVGRRSEILYHCVCDCGKEKNIRRSSLLSGAESCGCLVVDTNREKSTRHGDSVKGSPNYRLYRIWAGMKERCQNKSFRDYYRYGGRGINVCKDWSEWECFRDWALSNGYEDSLTIERINNNGDYSPDNCMWIPLGAQQNNTRRTIHILYQGQTYTAAGFSRLTGLPYDFVRSWGHQGLDGDRILAKFATLQ